MIENLKDLQALLKLCRKQGVTEIALPQVSFKLGDLPVNHPAESIEEEDTDEKSIYDPPTAEELTQWVNSGTQ